MRPTILTPDLNATTEVDVYLEYMRRHVEFLRGVEEKAKPEEKEEAGRLLAEAEHDLAEYEAEPEGPVIVIGYMPVAKKTELEHRLAITSRGKDGEESFNLEDLTELTEIARETVRWGVRGHRDLPDARGEEVAFAPISVEFRGRHYDIASDEMVDIYERNQWLTVLREEVLVFNAIGDSKKKQSSPSAGTDRQISDATSASASPPSGS